ERRGRGCPDEGRGQVAGGDAGKQVGGDVEEALLEPGQPGMRAPSGPGQAVELGGRVLERLALEEASQQQVALLEQQLLVEVGGVAPGQQAPRLQLHERRRDQEELGGHVEVEVLHALELGQVAVDDAAEGHLVDVDLLALTLPWEPLQLPAKTLQTAQILMAAGIDPERATLFVQSHVPEHSELCWVLNCVATMGELGRMAQFREKTRARAQDSVSV